MTLECDTQPVHVDGVHVGPGIEREPCGHAGGLAHLVAVDHHPDRSDEPARRRFMAQQDATAAAQKPKVRQKATQKAKQKANQKKKRQKTRKS